MTAVIAAAGSGERLGAGGPKAFVPLHGRSMVDYSIEAFRQAGVETIVLAVPRATALEGSGKTTIVDGGATRADSVSNALAACDTELVAIHDAARPLVTAELISGVIATLRANPDADAAIAATPVTDTIKRTPSGRVMPGPGHDTDEASLGIEETLDRGGLWAAQTPQVFRADALRDAIESAPADFVATDEAMLVERAGGRVLIHESSPQNLKVTTPVDLALAELLLARRAAG